MAKFDRRNIGYSSFDETGYVDGISAIGCGVGIYVVGAENLEINNPVVRNCDVPAVAVDSKGLKINNFQIDDSVVKQIWGDFASLKVVPSGELVAIGNYVATKPKKARVHYLKRSQLAPLLENMTFERWVALGHLLVALAVASATVSSAIK